MIFSHLLSFPRNRPAKEARWAELAPILRAQEPPLETMSHPLISNVIGLDDGPFSRSHRGDVRIVGAVFAGLRLDGILTGSVRRDGVNSTAKLCELIARSKFAQHVRLVMLQGIALAGFNVVDIQELRELLNVPVLVVARTAPDLPAIKRALLTRVSGGARKWCLVEKAGPMEPAAGVFVQRAGLSLAEAEFVIRYFAVNGSIPEPLRVAHMIAGGIVRGQSRGRP